VLGELGEKDKFYKALKDLVSLGRLVELTSAEIVIARLQGKIKTYYRLIAGRGFALTPNLASRVSYIHDDNYYKHLVLNGWFLGGIYRPGKEILLEHGALVAKLITIVSPIVSPEDKAKISKAVADLVALGCIAKLTPAEVVIAKLQGKID